jgi:hypothetical protein
LLGIELSPALISWLDNVIVPALVREYLVEMRSKNGIAFESELEIKSAFTDPLREGDS